MSDRADRIASMTTTDWRMLADWMEENVEVHVAPGLNPADIDFGIFDPDTVRDLAGEYGDDVEQHVNTADEMTLKSLIGSWQRDCDADGSLEPFRARLGTSPWRERRNRNPPTVPETRDDLVWMEWTDPMTSDEQPRLGQYHRADPTASVPVVGGAENAVLTTQARAASLDATACPDCFPETTDRISITDTETGLRKTINPDAIDEAPDEVLEELDDITGVFQDALDDVETDE